MTQWTDEMDEAIEEMHRQDMTFLAIAKAMNKQGYSFSRSAIQGRLSRLDKWRRSADMKVVRIKLTKPLGTPAELLDLDPDGCKWGISEDPGMLHRHLFCNAHRYGKFPYCYAHYCKSIGMRR